MEWVSYLSLWAGNAESVFLCRAQIKIRARRDFCDAIVGPIDSRVISGVCDVLGKLGANDEITNL